MGITENVADLLGDELQTLGARTLELLAKASLLGISWDLATLSLISGHTEQELPAILNEALERGFLTHEECAPAAISARADRRGLTPLAFFP